MTRNVKLAILRIRTDSATPVMADDPCLAMLWTGKHAVLRHWSDTTGGHLDFEGSAMFPWVDAALPVAQDRAAQGKVAIEAVRSLHPDHDPFKGFDGAVIIAHPGTGLNAGSAGLPGLPFGLISTSTATHTFMAHEIGHVLGFDHTFGLVNSGVDWNDTGATDPMYGSPFDLMSSASFGSLSQNKSSVYWAEPTFSGPVVAGWPPIASSQMGPHLARANLHHWLPDALAGRAVERPFPTAGQTVRTRLVATSLSSVAPSLLILHPPDESSAGVGRVYVEYRTATGWDAGLDPVAPSLSRVGVVVHSLTEVPDKGPRVWYRGSIPTGSIDTDVTVETTSLVVGVDEVDPAGQWVQVAIAVGSSHSARIAADLTEDIVGAIGPVTEHTTPCGGVYRSATWATMTTGQYAVHTTGFGGSGEPLVAPPTVTWTVNGQPLAEGGDTTAVAYNGSTFEFGYSIDPASYELRLTSRGGERITVPVVATVRGDGTTTTATANFDADGWYEGTHPDDFRVIGRCLDEMSKYVPAELPDLRRPIPDPTWGAWKLSRRSEQRWAERAIQAITEVPTGAGVREGLQILVQAQTRRLDVPRIRRPVALR